MNSLLLPLHLLAVGLWLGCVLTEVLFERALLAGGPEQHLSLARLHRRVDLVVEIPAFVLVLASGAFMLAAAVPGPLLQAKIGFGLLAVAANVGCVRLVLRRAAAADAGRWAEFARLDQLQHKLGAVVMLGILLALACGAYLLADS